MYKFAEDYILTNTIERCCVKLILDFFNKYDGKPLNVTLSEEHKKILYVPITEVTNLTQLISPWVDLSEFPCGYWPGSLLLFRDSKFWAAHMAICVGEGYFLHATKDGPRINSLASFRKLCTYVAEFKEGVRSVRVR